MNEFSNVRHSYLKLKVMNKNTYIEDNRKKRNLTANNCIFDPKLSHIWQNQSSLVIRHIDSFSTGNLTWGENQLSHYANTPI